MSESGRTRRARAALVRMSGLVVLALGVGLVLGRSLLAPVPPVGTMESAGERHAHAEPTAWTCSMHPQIQLPESGQCPICFMDLIPVAGGDDDDAGAPRLEVSEAGRALAEIVTTAVVRDRPFGEVRLVGVAEVDETRVATVTARAPGRLEHLYVDFTGSRIGVGDRVAEIYSPELLSAAGELRQAVASREHVALGSSRLLRDSADATVTAVREKLRLLGLTAAQVEAIASGGEVQDRVTVHAASGGIVIEKNAVVGDYVTTGSVIYRVADLSRLWVQLDAYEADLPWLREGQEVELRAEALPGEVLRGEVAFIAPTLDPVTRTVKVRVSVANGRELLKPGMYARAVVFAEVEEEALVIPRSAVLLTGKRALVYVEVPDTERPTYEGREVVLGPRAGEVYVVRSGLAEGEQVVVNGSFKIDSALQIVAKPSLMSPPQPGAGGTAEPGGYLAASAGFRAGLVPLYAAYFALGDALAADDAETARAVASRLADAVGALEDRDLSVRGRRAWRRLLQEHGAAVRAAAERTDLVGARAVFEDVSRFVVQLVETFGPAGGTFYRTHCPMAFDFKGADWLQSHDTVNNPYFGAQMLRCGSVTGAYAPTGAATGEERNNG